MMRPLLAALVLLAAVQTAHARDTAYCVNGKTSVESWDQEQMKVRHGSSQCLLNAGDDARKFLERNYGGTGKACSC